MSSWNGTSFPVFIAVGQQDLSGEEKGVPFMDLAKHPFPSCLKASTLTTKDQKFTLYDQPFVSQWFSLDLFTLLSLFLSITVLTYTSMSTGTSEFP